MGSGTSGTSARPDSGEVSAYLADIKRIPLLSPEEERALGERILTGDQEAMRELARHKLRLVPGIAAHYQARYHYRELPLPDLIQEGNVGLLRAAEEFD